MKNQFLLGLTLLTATLGCANAALIGIGSGPAILASVDDVLIDYTVPSTKGGTDYDRQINIRVKSKPAFIYNRTRKPTPIVIYSHGSSMGNANGHIDDGQEWTDELFRQGFITINIGHAPVETTSEQIAVCENVNLDNSVSGGYSGTQAVKLAVFGYR